MLFNLGKQGLPPQLWAPPSTKHRKNPATTRTIVSVQKPHSILTFPSGAQGCYTKGSPSSGSLLEKCTCGASATIALVQLPPSPRA